MLVRQQEANRVAQPPAPGAEPLEEHAGAARAVDADQHALAALDARRQLGEGVAGDRDVVGGGVRPRVPRAAAPPAAHPSRTIRGRRTPTTDGGRTPSSTSGATCPLSECAVT